jgi:hypothetical protein
MAPIQPVVELLEGESNRLIWLPPITLGYLYTITGETADFVLVVGAIGGSRLIMDLLDSEFVESEENPQMREDPFEWVDAHIPKRRGAILLFSYAGCVARSIWQLFFYFDHRNPVIVALAAIYWGATVIVLTNVRLKS